LKLCHFLDNFISKRPILIAVAIKDRMDLNRGGTMKKMYCVLGLALLASGATFPNLAFGGKLVGPVEFKFMAGASLSRSTELIGAYFPEFYPIAGYGLGIVAGGGVELPLARNIALEIDAHFFQKACRINILDYYTELPFGHYTERLNEISFPLLLKLCMKPGTSPYLLAGGEIAPILSTTPLRLDYGLVFGLGFRKKIGGNRLSIEGRYHLGFQDTLIGDVPLRKMRAFALMVGFSI
jgi:hypothetical protein